VADEVLVFDSGSTDATCEIARSMGARVEATPWLGYAQTKNEGMKRLQHPYVLSLDADEALSEDLRREIIALKASLRGAYAFPRLTRYCGRWIRQAGWYPDYKVRLFPRSSSTWVGDFVHEQLQLTPDQPLHRLKGDLLHYSLPDLASHLDRINHYSSLKAQALFAQGKPFRYTKLLLAPLATFLRMYLLQGGYREGYLGFQLCRLSAWSGFLKYAKLRELQKQEEHPQADALSQK
jgi:glycosyltransferase involved in cell wall biosynthesis